MVRQEPAKLLSPVQIWVPPFLLKTNREWIMITKIDNTKQPTFKMKILHIEQKVNGANPKSLEYTITKVEENVGFLDIPNALDKLGDLFKSRYKIRKHKTSGRGSGSTWIGKKW